MSLPEDVNATLLYLRLYIAYAKWLKEICNAMQDYIRSA